MCRHCGELYALSALAGGCAEATPRVDLESPPRGAWFQREFDGFRIGATTRSPVSLFLIPFFLVWTGLSLGMIYGPLLRGEPVETFKLLFGIPFVLASVVVGSVALQVTLGRTELVVDRGTALLFIGVGPLGYRRQFAWDEIDTVREEQSHVYSSGNSGRYSLVLEGARRVRFGTFLNDSRRYFLLRALTALLAERR